MKTAEFDYDLPPDLIAQTPIEPRDAARMLERFLDEHDYPPSIRDIQQGCDISSTSVVDYNLKRLEERGLIHRDREISRAIQLPGAASRRRVMTVPVLGKIAAGLPIPTPPEVLPEGYEEENDDANDAETRAFLDDHGLFGLAPESVTQFVQGMLPAVDRRTGDILREAPGVMVVDQREPGGYITPVDAAGESATFISRIREDHTVEHGVGVEAVAEVDREGAAPGARRAGPADGTAARPE